MKVEHPNKFNIQELEGLYLWKYLDLFKLIDLITTGEIYFQRFDKFEDGLEGLTGQAVSLMAFTQADPLTEENINKAAFNPEDQKKAILADKNRREELKKSIDQLQKTQFASCWFLDDRESLSMWKIYSKSDGIALKFKAKELTETIIASAESYTNSDFHILYYGKVDYKNIWPFDPHERFEGKFNGLKKDRSYSSENEFRFVSATSLEKIEKHICFRLPIGAIDEFDLEIITNPFMDSWKIEGLRKLLQKYSLHDKMSESKMKIKK